MRWFILGGIPIVVQCAHQITLAMLAAGVKSVAVKKLEQSLGKVVAKRMIAARLGTMAIGLTVPGLGWAMTVIAVGQTVMIALDTPTSVQVWLKYCIFGKPGFTEKVRGSWQEESAAWDELSKPDSD